MIKRITSILMLFLTTTVAGLFLYNSFLTRSFEKQFPPIGSFAIVEGVKLHYLDSGKPANEKDFRTLVLLHGASTSLLDFTSTLFTSLSQSWRVIAIDRPGHGYSDRPRRWTNPAQQAQLVAALLGQLQVRESVWIGHSWAGSVVLAGLLNHPQIANAGVSIAGVSHPWSSAPAWHVTLAMKPVLGKLFAHLLIPMAGRAALPDAIQTVFTPDRVPDYYREKTGVILSVRPASFIHNAVDRSRLSNWLKEQQNRYPEITQPVLLITSTADSIVPAYNHAQRLAPVLPSVTWKMLQAAGHAPHHSRAKIVHNEISQFLSELETH